ncbi:MAG TPA: sigma-70 family RNA polymerase sigma factor [Syntrophomonadaceae bacterium]|nr:sigma-70 family RNA polymerase sigma factor [Syntrophomonadaceae bacterium]
MHDNETEIILRARSGDWPALALLIDEYSPAIFKFARYLLASEQDAQDAAADIIVRLYEKRDKIPEQGFHPWLMRVTYNHCHDILRRRQVLGRILPRFYRQQAACEPSLDEALRESDQKALVQWGLVQLPEKERAALVLRYYYQMNYEEIGSILDASSATVGTWLHRGKEKLKMIIPEQMRWKV